MKKDEILNSIDVIRKVIDRQVSIDSPIDVLEKLNDLSQVTGLSGEIIARSKRLLNNAIEKHIGELFQMKPTDRKLLIEMRCMSECEILEIATALNKDLHYCLEACRSMLSYVKSEMQNISK